MSIHPTLDVIARYAGGDTALDEATVWSLEAHLETCPDCRARLAGSTTAGTRDLLDRISLELADAVAAGPAPVPVRRAWSAVHRRWFVRALLPWLTMTIAVIACAWLLQALIPEVPGLVLLLAPLAPLPGVAVAWSRRADPAWELIAATPAAGLTMLLRRTATVLVVVIPVLTLAGAGTGTSLALMLLPCLACTAATIAVGGLVGVARAAAGIATAWTAAVVLPSVMTEHMSVLLLPGTVPAWAVITVALAAVAVSRAAAYRRLLAWNDR